MRRTIVCLCLIAVILAVATAVSVAAAGYPDGPYRGRLLLHDGSASQTKVGFRMSKRGRKIVDLRTKLVTLCLGPGLRPNRFKRIVVVVPKIKVGSRGRFAGAYRPGKGVQIRYSGRRHAGAVRGELDVRVGACSAAAKFRARRHVTNNS